MTVMPAPSSASVNSRSVSGESSTTNATSRFFGSVIIAVQGFQGRHVLIEIEAVDQYAHLRDEVGVFREIACYFIELDLDRANITHLAEADQFFDVFHRRPRPALGLPVRHGDLVGFILPFDPEQLADGFQEPRNIDRL